MAFSVDAIIARRRLLRRIAFWRALAILAVIVALVTGIAYGTGSLGPAHIARLPITGAILSDRPLIKLVEELRKRDNVAAVVVAIDSPGGTSVGGERLYGALRELAEAKPVVSHINTVGASAGYMTAIATDHILAQRTSLTGSVGVLFQYGNVRELLNDVGIVVETVESGALKAKPNLFESADPAAVAQLQAVVDDSFDWFLSIVTERRELSAEQVATIRDGRVVTGRQALDLNLIDAIGGEAEALAWLRAERDVAADLPLRTYRPDDADNGSIFAVALDRVTARLLNAVGLDDIRVGPLSVDGLWALWHGPAPTDTKDFIK